jgi:hypothetical protein
MPVKGVDVGSLVQQPRSPYTGDMYGPIGNALQFVAEQNRLRDSAEQERRLREMQEMRLMNQAGLERQIRLQENQAREAQFRAQESRLQQQEEADRALKRQVIEDEARAELYKYSDNPELFRAKLKDFAQRYGYAVEEPGAGDASSPAQAPATPQKPDEQVTGPAKLPLARVGKQPPGPSYGALPEDEQRIRPAPARNMIENPGEAALIGGDQGVAQPEAAPQAPGAGVTGPEKLPPAVTEELPEARVEASKPGYRLRDKQGNVVFEFDPNAAFGMRDKSTLSAIGRLGAAARDDEEARAAGIAFGTAQDLIAGGTPKPEAYKQAAEAYRFELDRLGKVRRYGSGGGAAAGPKGLTRFDLSQRSAAFNQAFGLTKDIESRYKVAEINEAMNQAGTIGETVNKESGLSQTVALNKVVNMLQGSRPTDKDRTNIERAAGRLNEIETKIRQWTAGGTLPPDMIRELKGLASTISQLNQRRKAEISGIVGNTVRKTKIIPFKDDAEREDTAKALQGMVAGETGEPPQAPAQTQTPARPKKTKQQEVDDLLKSM